MLGKIVTFEGVEGSGKSTQSELLLRYLQDREVPVVFAREPGGTALGERVRDLLLDAGGPRISPRAELFLYLAARAQLLAEVIGPAQENDEWVILDRYVHSTIAYQGYGTRVCFGRSEHKENIQFITELCRRGVGGSWPDIVLLLDLPVEVGLARLEGKPDRIEKRDRAFHKRVREGYLTLAREEKDIFRIIDATAPVEELAAAVRSEVTPLLNNYSKAGI